MSEVYVGHKIEDGEVYSMWMKGTTIYQHHMKYTDSDDKLVELKANLYAILMVMSFDKDGSDIKTVYSSSVKVINSIREGSTYSDPFVFSMRSMIKLIYRKNYEETRNKLKFRFVEKDRNPICRKIKTK